MTKQRIASIMLEDLPWDGTELATPLSLPGALLAPSYLGQKQIVKPANPPAGSLRLYPKADNKFYQLDSAGNETVISGMSQGQSDGRYLQLSGGTLTGPLTATTITAQSIASSGVVSAGGDVVVGGNYKWGQVTDPEILYKEMPGRLRLTGAQLTIDSNLNIGSYTQLAEIATPVTPNTGQVRLYAKADHHVYTRDTTGVETDITFSKSQADVLYDPLGRAASLDAAHVATADPHPVYLTTVEGDARYAILQGGTGGNYITQIQGDARYLQLIGGSLSGALTVNNTLHVTQAVNFDSTLFVQGNAEFANRATFDYDIITSQIGAPGTTSLDISTSNTARWRITTTGILQAAADNAYDIGAVGSRPRNLIIAGGATIGGNSTIGGTLGITGNTTLGGTLGVTGTTTLANVLFGTGARILGDFTNATVNNRTLFQSSVVNGASEVGIIPNGTNQTSWIETFNRADPTNSGVLYIGIDNISVQVSSYKTGTGTALPLVFSTNATERMRLTVTGGLVYANSLSVQVYDTGGTIRNHMTFGAETLWWAGVGGGFRWVNQGNSVQWMGLDTSGNLAVAGSLSTGTSATLNGGLTVFNHTMMSQATGGVGSSGASEGQIELQNGGSGAAKIAFHRTGSYAIYLGLDTDNVLAAGGWSMGAARYRVILGDGFTNLAHVSLSSVGSPIYYMAAVGGSYYVQLSNTNYFRTVAMHIMSDGQFCFNANPAINWSWDGTNIKATHQVWAPSFTCNGGGTYNMLDTNVRIARPNGTNIMYIYAYDAQWAFIRTSDSANCGYVDGSGFHGLSKLKYKTAILPIQDGLKLVLDQRVKPISFKVKSVTDKPDIPSLGFGAEDMAQVVPNAVGYDDEGPASINYGSLVAVLWDAVRTLNARIETLEKTA